MAATLLAAGLALHGLGARSFWFDEAFSVGIVDRPVGDALWRIGNWELNQSPYHLLLIGWHRLGDGEAFLRLLSVVFAVATVPVVFAVGRRIADEWVGAIAALVIAGHALVLQWAQQLRGYTLTTLLVAAATLLLLRAVERPSTGRSVAYAVVAAVTAYSHFVAAFVIVAHGLSLLVVRPFPWRFVRVAAATGAVLAVPLAAYLVTRQGDPLSHLREPSTRDLAATFADLTGGRRAQPLVVGPLALLGAVVLLGQLRQRFGTIEAWRAALPVLWVLVPVAGVLVSTYTVKPLLATRFLIVVVPAVAVLVAAGVRHLGPRLGAIAVGALVVVSAQAVSTWYGTGSAEDWRGAVALVVESARPGDEVVTLPDRAVHAVRYYGPALDTVSPSQVERFDAERVWVVDRVGQFDRIPFAFPELLAERYDLVEEHHFTDVDVRLYVRR